MKCRNWEERIVLYAEGDLPPEQAAEAERHLVECAECRELAGGITRDLSILRAAHAEPISPAHLAAVRAGVLEQIQRESRPARRLGWMGALVAAAAVLVLLFLPRRVEPPRIAVTPPPAPLYEPVAPAAAQPVPPKRAPPARPKPRRRPPAEPLMVKLITDDPNVVIYWIAN